MRKLLAAFVYLLCLVGLFGFGYGVHYSYKAEKEKAEVKQVELVQEEVASQPIVDPLLPTRDFARKLMKRCNAKLSVARQEILIGQIVRVSHDRFQNESDRQAFMMILCIESAFNQDARSPVGAVGIAQIMPQYIDDFSKLCGYSGIDSKDLFDTEVNLTLGGCLFNHLIKETGNTYLAAASYNAGASSSSVKNLKSLKAAVPETANYVAKIAILKDEVKRASDIISTDSNTSK